MRILIFTLVFGCTVDGLDLEGRECPCVTGWRCDEARNVCVREDDAGVMDVGVDAPTVDGGRDSGPVDSSTDASGDDAGRADGGPSDAGLDTPPIDATPPRSTECDDLDVLLCEGFEDNLDDWSVETSNGDIDIVVGPDAFRGRGMLVASVDRADSFSIIYQRVWEDDTTDLWIRVHYYFDPAFFTETEMFEIFNTGYDYSRPHLLVPGTYANIHAHGLLADESWVSSIAPSAGSWHCVEMHMRRHPANGYVELFIDDAMALRTPDLAIPEPFNELSLGMVYAETEGVVYIDEVAADTSRIPCP